MERIRVTPHGHVTERPWVYLVTPEEAARRRALCDALVRARGIQPAPACTRTARCRAALKQDVRP